MSEPQPSPFRALHHVCIVVCNIDSAVAYYESLGVGLWQDFPSLDIFRDELSMPDVDAFMQLRYRYCNLDNIQIQLCEPGEGALLCASFWTSMEKGFSIWASLCRIWMLPKLTVWRWDWLLGCGAGSQTAVALHISIPATKGQVSLWRYGQTSASEPFFHLFAPYCALFGGNREKTLHICHVSSDSSPLWIK